MDLDEELALWEERDLLLARLLSATLVRLSLEQLPARGEDLDQLASLLPFPEAGPPSATSPMRDFEDIVASTRLRLLQVEEGLVAGGNRGVRSLRAHGWPHLSAPDASCTAWTSATFVSRVASSIASRENHNHRAPTRRNSAR